MAVAPGRVSWRRLAMRLIRLAVAQAAAVMRGRRGREVMQPAGELEAGVEAVALWVALLQEVVAAAEAEVEVAAPALP